MNRMLLLLVFVLSLNTRVSTVRAASSHPAQRVPVVATWFSDLRPVSGHREVLSVQFSRDTHGLAGGRFSATIRYGRHVLYLKGGTTNGRGIASVTFTVPQGLKGTGLRATSMVVFKGQRYLGGNHVTVVR